MPDVRPALPRLYAILDFDLLSGLGHDPLAIADLWFDAGVRLVQLRAKSLTFGPMLAWADAAVPRAQAAGAALLVNDRADVARLSGAAGVHLGQDDLAVAAARRLVGPAALVGLSTHTREQARVGCAQAVSYLAVGPVFRTASKAAPDDVVGLEGVREAADLAAGVGLPLVAIGGITLERVPEVLAAGAASVAVISDLFVGDPAVRVRQYLDVLG